MVSDSDGGGREAVLEAAAGALRGGLLAGKHPERFGTLRFTEAQADSPGGVSKRGDGALVALIWSDTVVKAGQSLPMVVRTPGDREQIGSIDSSLTPLSPLTASMVHESIPIPMAVQPMKHQVRVRIDGEGGRYRLDVQIKSGSGRVLAEEARTIFVY
jgi:hypothetical protein